MADSFGPAEKVNRDPFVKGSPFFKEWQKMAFSSYAVLIDVGFLRASGAEPPPTGAT